MNIVIVGEAYGEAEEREKKPFIGAAGYELGRMLTEAGIERKECFLTNVFNLRPPGNKIKAICGPKGQAIKGYPPIVAGGHVPQSFIPELERLGDEIVQNNPNLILALGNTATWALLGRTGITKIRGTTALSTHTARGYKVLPTYHPAAVLREWYLRPIAVIDFVKAERESKFPEVRRPRREIWIEPTLADLHTFEHTYLSNSSRVSVDIETSGTEITCVGISPRQDLALVIPFEDERKKGHNYWKTEQEEREAWRFIKRIMENKKIEKVFQNGLYDISFLLRAQGIGVYGAEHDTMLLHHALQPESLKGLGFLGSVYTDEGNWKDMRKVETIKRDD